MLAENDTRQHEDDFREDFGLYWLNWSGHGGLPVRILPGAAGARANRLVHAILTDWGTFVFPSKVDAHRFWTNLKGAPPRQLKRTAVISINPLPAPDRYPVSATDLWTLVEARSDGGTDLLAQLMANDPIEAFVVLAGTSPAGREHYAAVRIHRPIDALGRATNRRAMRTGIEHTEAPIRTLFGRYGVQRLATDRLDASSTRLPGGTQQQLSKVKVIIVGCGALGSGVARLLAQAGVEHLRLVDPENLGWENIRRHELGARVVGYGKAEALAGTIRADLPLIRSVQHHRMTFATFARNHPDKLKRADLIVSCTGEWVADASVEHALHQPGQTASAVYGWMEAHALAAHAVFIGADDATLSDGFNEDGEFRQPVVTGGKPPPAECGGASTPFGAVELAHAQALVARLAIDALRGLARAPIWRSWLADAAAFGEADASVTSGWAAARGQPDEAGGPYEGDWTFP